MPDILKVINREPNGSVRVKLQGCGLQPETCGHYVVSIDGSTCLNKTAASVNTDLESHVVDEDEVVKSLPVWGYVRCGVMMER